MFIDLGGKQPTTRTNFFLKRFNQLCTPHKAKSVVQRYLIGSPPISAWPGGDQTLKIQLKEQNSLHMRIKGTRFSVQKKKGYAWFCRLRYRNKSSIIATNTMSFSTFLKTLIPGYQCTKSSTFTNENKNLNTFLDNCTNIDWFSTIAMDVQRHTSFLCLLCHSPAL